MRPSIVELRELLLEGKGLSALSDIPVKVLSLPPRLISPDSSPLALINHLSPQMAELVEAWIQGEQPPSQPAGPANITIRPVCTYGNRIASYVEKIIEQTKPDLILFDAPPLLGLGAGIIHAVSIHNFIGLPFTITLSNPDGGLLEAGKPFFSGSALETTIIKALLLKIPVVPVGMPFRPVNTRSNQLFQQLLDAVYEEFNLRVSELTDESALNREVRRLGSKLWNSGISLSEERGSVVNECCYLASRVRELLGMFNKRKRPVKILLLVDLKLYQDLPSLVNLLNKNKGIHSEFYLHPQKEADFHGYRILTHNLQELFREAQEKGPETTLAQTMFEKEFKSWISKKKRMHISLEDADELIARLLEMVRNHPLIERGAGVRGSLSLREIAQGYALINGGKLTYQAIEKAALIALPHRLILKPGKEDDRDEIVEKVVLEVLYGLGAPTQDRLPRPGDMKLTKENIRKILEGLSDVAFKRLDDLEKGIPDFDQSLADEMMNHPLIQEALKNLQYPEDSLPALKKLLDQLERRDITKLISPNHYSLTEKGQRELSDTLREKLARGEITKEELEQALKKAGHLSSGSRGVPIDMPKDKLTNFVAELMDVQHQGRAKETSLEDVYVHYTLNEKKGVKTDPEKLDYQKLQMMIHELEKKGLVRSGEKGKTFTLTAKALTWLLDELVPKTHSEPLIHNAFKKEHETDKAEVRRYKKGDVFRDISVRHTLREVVKQGKSLEDISVREFRSFEKKQSLQLDIALCIDVSASMKDQFKLRYAKMALVGLIKAALEKHDRVGIIAFSNRGEVIAPLTDKVHLLLDAMVGLRAEQYTNIGNGLRCAREMLMRAKDGNKKYIILITDGQPNAATAEEVEKHDPYKDKKVSIYSNSTYWDHMIDAFKSLDWKKKEELGTSHALTEALMCRDKDIKISTLLITQQDQQGEWLARRIATIGRGRYYKVKTPESLPLDALNIVQ
jgi:Mg-chelatase subunit ChlD